jgi:hypothetical protein
MNRTAGAMIELPRYRCHKEVWALKIARVETVTIAEPAMTIHDETRLHFADTDYAPISVTDEWVQKHGVKAGGYYVVYKDGYKSFSPADAFEDGYTRI